MRIADTGDYSLLPVTLERIGDERTTVAETTVAGEYGTVYRTSEPGLYAVSMDLGDRTCERRFEPVRRNRKPERGHVGGSEPGSCPVRVEVDVSSI